MNPTRTEKLYWSRLVGVVGCIACRIDGTPTNHCSIHHIDGRTKPGAHLNVLPLCARHHQTGGTEAPSIHPWKRRFESKYGTQAELQARCNEILLQQEKQQTQGAGGNKTAPADTETFSKDGQQGILQGSAVAGNRQSHSKNNGGTP